MNRIFGRQGRLTAGARSARFDLPESSFGLVVTNLLELPFFLPLPEGGQLFLAEPRTDAWEGISSEATSVLLQLPGAQHLDDEHVATTRLVFRSAAVRTRLPLQAADITFGNWVDPLLSRQLRRRRARTLRRMTKTGITMPVSVVAATRLLPRSLWDEGEHDDHIDNALDFCLSYLNEYIVSVAVATGDARLRPIAKGELPITCPVILEAVGLPERVGTTFIRQIHQVYPHFSESHRLPADACAAAARLAMAGRRGDEPLFLFFELFHGAQAALLQRQGVQAVVLCGTATEVAIDVILSEGLALDGASEKDIHRELAQPFAQRVEAHLARITNTKLDRTEPTSPLGLWWRDAYSIRNRVVHDGYRPSYDEAQLVLEATVALVDALSEGLRSQSRTESLGDRLHLTPPHLRA